MRKGTWEDVTARRKKAGLSVISWAAGTKSKKWCDLYADDHARWLALQLSRKRIAITARSLYIAWNCGLSVAIDVRGESSGFSPKLKARFNRFDTNIITH